MCHAPVARTWCTMPRVLKCVAWIAVLATLHQLPRFIDKVYEPLTISWRGQDAVTVCKVSLGRRRHQRICHWLQIRVHRLRRHVKAIQKTLFKFFYLLKRKCPGIQGPQRTSTHQGLLHCPTVCKGWQERIGLSGNHTNRSH